MTEPVKMLRALAINPHTRTITEVQLEDSLQGMYAAMRQADHQFTGTIEAVRLGPGVTCWVDEEGNLSDGRIVWSFGHGGQKLTGGALLTGETESGETESLSLEISATVIEAIVNWTGLVSTGCFEPGSEGYVEHPIFGRTYQVTGGQPIFRPADPIPEANTSTKH
jgi:hypothetical protein